MIGFSTTTTFEIVRRVASIGLSSPSIYVLICEPEEMEAIEADLRAEVEVQLGSDLQTLDASSRPSYQRLEAIAPNTRAGVVLLTMRRWEPELIVSVDRNIVLVTRAGPLLLLTTLKIAERTLVAAPNLRSRITDVLSIKPDPFLRQAPA
ncbi:MAG TPA: hypothetical protein VHU83_24155 [Bryobacteraceae bacterium]|jgi:hypothetical protein|nr:hypothetical protein [Bryobacteraceae bacterium]